MVCYFQFKMRIVVHAPFLREIPARDRQSRRPQLSSPTSAIHLSPSHPLVRSLRAERLHPPSERIAHHRVGLPPASHQPLIFQGQRGGAMPRDLNTAEPCREFREEQASDRQGGRSAEYQGARLGGPGQRPERNDCVHCSVGSQW